MPPRLQFFSGRSSTGKTIALIFKDKGKTAETSMEKIRWAEEKTSTISSCLHPNAFQELFQLSQ